jgi:hypothetical protein
MQKVFRGTSRVQLLAGAERQDKNINGSWTVPLGVVKIKQLVRSQGKTFSIVESQYQIAVPSRRGSFLEGIKVD